nr:odorant-binding protein [Plautia stali]
MNRSALLLLVVLVASAVGWPQPPPPPPPGGEDVPEECRPKPPQRGKERTVCCDMPHPIANKDSEQFKTMFEECKEIIKSEHPEVMPPHHSHPPPPPPPPAAGAPPPPPPPPHHGGPHLFMTCMDECVFNKSGLLTDSKLNQEALTKTVDNFAPDGVWKPIALEATKFCYEKSNETKADEKDGKCNPVPHDFAKCMIKQMYLKCPSEKWQNNDECNAEKQTIEKCPNLMPFPPHPPMKKKE